MKKLLVVLLALTMVFCIFSCGNNEEVGTPENPLHIKCGHPDPQGEQYSDFHYQQYIKMLNQYLEESCDGAIVFDEVGGGQLGTEAEMFSGVSDGSIDSACTSIGAYSSNVPVLEIFNLPFIFAYSRQFEVLTEDEHFISYVKQIMEDEHDCILLTNTPVHCGYRALLTHKPVNTVADLKDMVVRITSSDLNQKDWNALGTIPTVIPYGEVYTSMQQGAIDAICMPIEALYMNAYWEVSEYMITINMHDLQGWHIINKDLWESLTAEQQGWIKEAAEKALQYQLEGNDKHVAQLTKEFEEKGVTVIDPDKEEMKTLSQAAVLREYREIIGAEIFDYAIDLLNKDNAAKGYSLITL